VIEALYYSVSRSNVSSRGAWTACGRDLGRLGGVVPGGLTSWRSWPRLRPWGTRRVPERHRQERVRRVTSCRPSPPPEPPSRGRPTRLPSRAWRPWAGWVSGPAPDSRVTW